MNDPQSQNIVMLNLKIRAFIRLLRARHLRLVFATLCMTGLAARPLAAADALEAGFVRPPEQTKPWCYWYWISDNISQEGLTADLEAMARVGIGEAFIGNIHLKDIPSGDIKVLSPEWWALVEHAIREGRRLGVNIGLFNSPGWSQSGGPWVRPDQAMRHLVSAETRVRGPGRFERKLDRPELPFKGVEALSFPPAQDPPPDPEDFIFQDVAVLAFPAPRHDAETLSALAPQVTMEPPTEGVERLTDGDRETSVVLKRAATIDLRMSEPLTARSLVLTPGPSEWSANVELLAADQQGGFHPVKAFKFDRSNMRVNVGPSPRAPVIISFPSVTARQFRLVFQEVKASKPGHHAALAGIDLTPAARLESGMEKQLAKMHPTPLPMWDSYLWPPANEPEDTGLVIAPEQVIDLTSRLDPDGTLRWEVPAGDWVIVRTGMMPTGTRNSPASLEGQGLEIDKMNRDIARAHFDAFVGPLLERMPPDARTALRHVVADSYEMGSQNWTDGFGEVFRERYGYDPAPWLPVLTGRIVGSADQSDRFLWDLRRLVADRIATEYVGGMRDLAREHGLELWLENYGHWGFPGEFLQYGGQSDRIGGEFWATGQLGSIELRAASSCANTYGKPVVSAEAFTGGPQFRNAPAGLKARGDWAFCQGINHFVLHVYIHQPWEDRQPGINAPWGTEINRHNTWLEQGRAWMDYLRRCSWMLQQGTRVADVAYFIGEDTPKMTGVRRPELPGGCDFDYINAEVILDKLAVKDGLLVLPHGTTYRVLVLPELETMRPEVLRKLVELSKAGAAIFGPAPTRSPSLQNHPQCDAEVRRLAAELRTVPALEVPPDFLSDPPLLFTHRRTDGADIYFLSNQDARDVVTRASFRVTGRQPELWDPVTGDIRSLPDWTPEVGRTVIPLELPPHGSAFVVFRRPVAQSAAPATTRNFPVLKPVQELTGPWEAHFDPRRGGPDTPVEFRELADWSHASDPSVTYYSGTAVYRTTFPSLISDLKSEMHLDLGPVHDLARVRLNGRELGTVWTAPWRVRIPSGLLKQDGNALEIEVVNVWNNRLVADRDLPPDRRRTFLTHPLSKEAKPMPAGLLGPVRVMTAREWNRTPGRPEAQHEPRKDQ
jgi:hypothetical protein